MSIPFIATPTWLRLLRAIGARYPAGVSAKHPAGHALLKMA